MSGRKNRLVKYQNITSGDMASSITSAITNIEGLDNIGIQLNWSGSSPVGTFAVQVSADYAQDFLGNVTNTGNWSAISISPSVAATGAASDTAYIAIQQLAAPWLRVVYTRTSGTGTLQGFFTAKQI